DSPHANAVVVDRQISPTSDMQKAQMDGDRILRMNKNLPDGVADAEVVGPAKFDRDGAARIVAYLDRLIAKGDRNRWSYEVFGLVAEQLTFAGVDNPDCFWAEVDTPTEALDANQRIPPALVDLAGRRLEPAPPIERRRTPATDHEPGRHPGNPLNV